MLPYPFEPEPDDDSLSACYRRGNSAVYSSEYDAAITLYSEVIRRGTSAQLVVDEPDFAYLYWAFIRRGIVQSYKGDYAAALADYEAALALWPDSYPALRSLARFLASCPNAVYRHGERSLGYAHKICADILDVPTGAPDFFERFDTLASSCAEVGDFDAAVKWQVKAMESLIADNPTLMKALLPEYQSRLDLYQSWRPFRTNSSSQ